MYYGGSATPIHIEDRALAHLKVVIATKLRRGESFTVSWRHPDDQPRGRSTIWLHPSIPLRFVFDDPEPADPQPGVGGGARQLRQLLRRHHAGRGALRHRAPAGRRRRRPARPGRPAIGAEGPELEYAPDPVSSTRPRGGGAPWFRRDGEPVRPAGGQHELLDPRAVDLRVPAPEEVELQRHRRVHPEAPASAAIAHLDVEHERLRPPELVHDHDAQMGERPVVDLHGVAEVVVDESPHGHELNGGCARTARR